MNNYHYMDYHWLIFLLLGRDRFIFFYILQYNFSKESRRSYQQYYQKQAIQLVLMPQSQYISVLKEHFSFLFRRFQLQLVCDQICSVYSLSHNNIFLRFLMRSVLQLCKQAQKLIFHKIHFTLKKKVKFGQAVYVCGSILQFGFWNPQRAFRLKWNEGDVWTGTILLTINIPENIQYKYVVANWDFPNPTTSQWETGDHNRQIDLARSRSLTICDDKWNVDNIILILITKKEKLPNDERFYVVGDIIQLGAYQEKKIMKRVVNNYISYQLSKQQEIYLKNENKQLQLWTYSFQISREKSHFCYYYMKKGERFQTQRKPGRIFKLNDQNSYYPKRFKVTHSRGDITIYDECRFNQLIISQITPQIYVGSHIKSSQDIKKLKENNISSILSIQSERDFKKNGVSSHYLSILCQQNDIKYKKCPIEDMNSADFISKAQNGVKIMESLLSSGNRVYVHCSAGIYRSPQMIALYLVTVQKYGVQEAVRLLKERHPYAKPSCKTVSQAVNELQHKKNKQIYI